MYLQRAAEYSERVSAELWPRTAIRRPEGDMARRVSVVWVGGEGWEAEAAASCLSVCVCVHV